MMKFSSNKLISITQLTISLLVLLYLLDATKRWSEADDVEVIMEPQEEVLEMITLRSLKKQWSVGG